MPVTSLYHIARKACIKNIRSITDVGDVPYELIRPVLLKLENPEQLRVLEEASPQLCGPDAELWLEFIKRDIPNWADKPHEPKNPRNWYKVYKKLRAESQKEVDADAEVLKAAMEGIKTERAKHTSRIVDAKTVPRLPRTGRMKLAQGHTTNTSLLTFSSGSKTKMLTGKGVIDKARREARELSLFSARKSLLATPTHKLNNKATAVRSAPQGLVSEHRKPAAPRYTEPTPKPTTIFAPRRRSIPTNPSSSAGGLSVEERERRLRALTSQKTTREPSSPAASSPPPSSTTSAMSPPASNLDPASSNASYRVPRMNAQASGGSARPTAKMKAPVDPFMPAKRRKVV